jgi:hypothetical protein
VIRLLLIAALLGQLGGCAAVPMVLSGVGGAMAIAKDGFDLDVSFRNWLRAP